MMDYYEKTIERKKMYKGNIIGVDLVSVTLPNGKEASRDVVTHPGASVVIPVSENNELYMVRQFRKPIEKELLEIPAGKLDPGEDPMVCAHRELKEETGLVSDNLRHVIDIHSAPGFCDEVLHMYIATDLKEGKSCVDEDEFLSVEKVPVNKLVEMIINHEITDAKTIIGVLLADKYIKGEIKI